jgi:hypothetical protein
VYEKAVKSQSKLRLAIMGPSGSGKTFTALSLGTELARLSGADKILVLDSEKGSSAKFADLFSFYIDEIGENQSLQTYCEKIKMAEAAGIKILIIDSLSHAWAGRAGALEQLDSVNARGSNPNKMSGWAVITPLYHRLLDCITGFPGHVICTLRSKTEWVIEEVNGKKVPRKVGLAPVARDGIEYEYDVALQMFEDHNAGIVKARVHGNPDLQVGQIVELPGAPFAGKLWKWLMTGAEPRLALQSPQNAPQPAAPPPPTQPSSLPSPVSPPPPAVQPPPVASAQQPAQPQIVPSPRASAPQPTSPPPSSAPSGSAPSAPPQPSPQPTPPQTPTSQPDKPSAPQQSPAQPQAQPSQPQAQPSQPQPKSPDLKQLLRAALGEWCVINKIPKDKAAHMLFPGNVQTLDAATDQDIRQIASNLSQWYRQNNQLADPATRPNMYRLMVGFQLLK